MKTPTLALLILFTFILLTSYKGNAQTATASKKNYKVTFYELGSVRCIPCKQMQPVLKAIEEKYKDKVQVIFYDVWTKEGKEAAKNFTFEAIPTQIFLDKNGKEFFRHEGFFPEEEIVKMLQQKGIK
ncbi:MAG: thioredoxin family protein [Lentimicrobium sp.]|jgi:thioredoxin 1|nr:thioredoxin family protein [Lentimicrobium sp.]